MQKIAISVEIGEIVELENYGTCEVLGKDVAKNQVVLLVEDFGNGYKQVFRCLPGQLQQPLFHFSP